jgi:pilus assembly protein Flp/PilA
MAFALIQLRTWLSSVAPDLDDDQGASLVEYALLLALIAVACVVAMTALGNSTNDGLSSAGSMMP